MKNLLENRLKIKKKLRNKDILFGGWISFANPSISEIFSYCGFDFIAIDIEHSTISNEQAQRIIASSQANGVPCLPRPVSYSNNIIKPLLDSGADGMIFPTVNKVEDVKKLIQNIKYPPIGNRTYGINRAQIYGFDSSEYFKKWNQSSSIIIQVESIEAVNNINDLIEFDEIDAVMIGPYDLSGSLGVSGELDHPLVKESINKVIEACNKKKISCGTQIADPNKENIENTLKIGHNFIFLSSDLFVLWKWSEKIKNILKDFQK